MSLLAWGLPLALAGAGLSWRHAWWRRGVDERWPRILMYHRIAEAAPGAPFRGLCVSPRRFEAQLRWLQAQGWQGFTVSELVRRAGHDLPPRALAITFDDGYADNFTEALPLLQRYGFPATLYLVVDRHGRDWSRARDARRAGALAAVPRLGDEQVRAMLDSGWIELGAHTVTHPDLRRLGDAALRHELVHGREQLEQRFGVPVASFAYPFGRYRPEQVEAVRAAGYTSAVTVREGIDDPAVWKPLELARVKVSGREGMAAFRLRLRTGRRRA
ncbi:MAG TPA: polysaccharide deacetylase family protein [Thiotrichales bacterium]|nr:polysaccharide deacetylase family protein [Thiotrichales bacterium]